MTRPHPAPAQRDYSIEDVVEINERIRKERKEAARQAREDVLKDLQGELNEMGCLGERCCRDYLKEDWLPKYRKSLRGEREVQE